MIHIIAFFFCNLSPFFKGNYALEVQLCQSVLTIKYLSLFNEILIFGFPELIQYHILR